MLIEFKEKTVTYKSMLNGEPVVCKIESVNDNNISLKIVPLSYPNHRGSLNEFGNNVKVAGVTNSVNATNLLYDYLLTLQNAEGDPLFLESDLIKKIAIDWAEDDVDVSTYPIRIAIDKDEIIDELSDYIEAEKAKGYPIITKSDYKLLYVNEILPEFVELLASNINILVEHKIV